MRSIARITPRLTLVRPTLVPVGDQHNNTGHGLSSFVTADLAGYKTAPPAELAV
ncbi:hypothetical protein HPE43_11020 [Escherichia coli]|nr:hypothetical protein HPE43_11020 [Escherichia coli]